MKRQTFNPRHNQVLWFRGDEGLRSFKMPNRIAMAVYAAGYMYSYSPDDELTLGHVAGNFPNADTPLEAIRMMHVEGQSDGLADFQAGVPYPALADFLGKE